MSNSLPKQKKLISISQAAKVLGVSIDTVRRWDKSGILHSERLDGKNRYFSLDELTKHKLHQPLPISDVARQLNISPTTLRRLEERGLIKPERNNAGERIYDKDLIKNFLNSDYFLRKKQIKEKVHKPDLKEKDRREPAGNEVLPLDQDWNVPSRMPAFFAVSSIMFILLVALGFRNIMVADAKNLNVLSETTNNMEVEATPEPQFDLPFESTTEAQLNTPEEATAEATIPMLVRVTIKNEATSINIRQEATTSAEKIGQAQDGDIFDFVSLGAEWYEVKLTDGQSGFILAEYVEELR